jgi:DNA-nicking Smr family endonuclease
VKRDPAARRSERPQASARAGGGGGHGGNKPRPAGSVRHLSELKALKSQMDAARREAAAHEARARAEAQRKAREQRLFEQAVGAVQPLKAHGRAELQRAQPAPLPRQREADERAVLREALSDQMDVERLLETDEGLSFRRRGIGPDVLKRLRRGEWAIQAQVDLHGLRREQARERLSEFLREAARRGLRCVRVVHGKGLGSPGREPVLKGKVRAWLVQKADVLAFTQARAAEGGAGALVVLLHGRSGSVRAECPGGVD